MSSIPTESRIFGDRYYRDIRRLEKLHAGRISPGTHTWETAINALYKRLAHGQSPIKRAIELTRVIDYLDGITPEERAHFIFIGSRGKRSASLVFATFNAGMHPYKRINEEGLSVVQHLIYCQRNGTVETRTNFDLAYVSLHAMRRLHERGHKLTAVHATGVFGYIGLLGFMTRNIDGRVNSQLNLHFGDTLITGSLRRGYVFSPDGEHHQARTFYDVRTALPADEVRDPAQLEQGRIAAHVVTDWFAGERDPHQIEALVKQIPFLPQRENDYVTRLTTPPMSTHETAACDRAAGGSLPAC